MAEWMDSVSRDLKFTRRVLNKNPAFTATAVVTLALGIAASTAIYSVVDTVLLKPLDYQNSGDLYRVHTVDTVGLPRGTTGPPHIDPMAEEGQSIQAAMYGYSFEQSVVNGEGTAFAVNEFRTSEEFFKVFTEPIAPRPCIRARRQLPQHGPELSDLARRVRLRSQHHRAVHQRRQRPADRRRRGGRGIRVPRRHGDVDADLHGAGRRAGPPAAALQHAGLRAREPRRLRRATASGARRLRGPAERVVPVAGRPTARVRRATVASRKSSATCDPRC